MNVLSLFDGMSCGRIAFEKSNFNIDNYYAYEIDKYAIEATLHNFPDVQELGDVFNADFTKHNNIDWLIGGSPCTYWSIAQSPDKRETTASGFGWDLFLQYVRALHEAKPNFFIYENNKSMSKDIYRSISQTFGFEPIMINSALVSAQNRRRFYWIGRKTVEGKYEKIIVKQPADKGILLNDILDSGENLTGDDKSHCLTARYDGAHVSNTIERRQRTMVAEPIDINSIDKDNIYKVENGIITIKDKSYPIKLNDGYYTIRKLTIDECKALQTVPKWYDFSCVSKTQAYKMLGNGWTVDVIVHILNQVHFQMNDGFKQGMKKLF